MPAIPSDVRVVQPLCLFFGDPSVYAFMHMTLERNGVRRALRVDIPYPTRDCASNLIERAVHQIWRDMAQLIEAGEFIEPDRMGPRG